jgi:hypothetical protein
LPVKALCLVCRAADAGQPFEKQSLTFYISIYCQNQLLPCLTLAVFLLIRVCVKSIMFNPHCGFELPVVLYQDVAAATVYVLTTAGVFCMHLQPN